MEDLINEAGNGSEDLGTSQDKPISIRDSLRAAIDSAESGSASGGERQRDEHGRFAPRRRTRLPRRSKQPLPRRLRRRRLRPPLLLPPSRRHRRSLRHPSSSQPQRTVSRLAGRQRQRPSSERFRPRCRLPSRREQEVDNGFRVLQDYKGLEEFTPIVRQAGTTHADVMRKAIDWEQSLIRDPVNTVIHVAKMAGVNLHALVAGQQDQILQRRPQQAQQQPTPQPVNVEATVEQVLRKRDTETQVNAFISDPANVHAEAVLDDMVALISAGRASSLKDAYDAACWMRPDIRQQLISQAAPATTVQDQTSQRAAAADQARRASRSISGSSAPGPTQGAGAGQPTSIRDSLRSALHAANGRV